jgi:hypothetical protein
MKIKRRKGSLPIQLRMIIVIFQEKIRTVFQATRKPTYTKDMKAHTWKKINNPATMILYCHLAIRRAKIMR